MLGGRGIDRWRLPQPRRSRFLTGSQGPTHMKCGRQPAGFLGPPVDSRGFHVGHWLRDGGLHSMAPEDVRGWIEADIDERAWYAATFVPPVLSEHGAFSWARELLECYGDRGGCQRNLQANFRTESFTGPISGHLEAKRRHLAELREQETNTNVRNWLDEFIAILDDEIRGARIAEERDESRATRDHAAKNESARRSPADQLNYKKRRRDWRTELRNLRRPVCGIRSRPRARRGSRRSQPRLGILCTHTDCPPACS